METASFLGLSAHIVASAVQEVLGGGGGGSHNNAFVVSEIDGGAEPTVLIYAHDQFDAATSEVWEFFHPKSKSNSNGNSASAGVTESNNDSVGGATTITRLQAFYEGVQRNGLISNVFPIEGV